MTSARDIDLILKSIYFDERWYRESYPDVAFSGLEPAEHYLRIGARIGRDPGPRFSTRDYLAAHPEAAAGEINPLVHYASAGAGGDAGPSDYAVIVHAYHPDCLDDLRRHLDHFPAGIDRYVSYPRGAAGPSEATVRAAFPGAVPVAVENAGQDVGAFLQVLERIDRGRYAFYCKLHSKAGDKLPGLWRRTLLEGTVGGPERVAQFERIFRDRSDVLLGGARELFLHGPSHVMENGLHLERLLRKAGLSPDPAAAEWGFFAGTFFWIRAEAVERLMACLAAADFAVETARRDGQLAHAVERLAGLLPQAMGGRVALASCLDADAEVAVESGFPDDLPRAPRPIVETLYAIHHGRLARRAAEMAAGRPGPGVSRGRGAGGRGAAYSIITPTGDRAAAFNLCRRMVVAQTVPPAEWVVVDDGRTPLTEQLMLPDWVSYVRRAPAPDDPPHTLARNVLAALGQVTTDRVLIVEDDDWYSPLYAEYMLPYLETHDMVGLQLIRYYHLQGSAWKHGFQPAHTAFAQTAFRRGHAWDHLAAVCRTDFTEIREKGLVDRRWWQSFEGSKLLLGDHPCLHLGVKGGFGRPGLASGHARREPDYKADPDGAYLREAIGPDRVYYNRWRRRFRKPYVIYTAVAGGHDTLKAPLAELENFDLYAFSDAAPEAASAPEAPEPWRGLRFDEIFAEPARTARKPKILPHLYFPDYEWSLWIDANLFILEDLDIFVGRAIEKQAGLAVFESSESDTVEDEIRRLGARSAPDVDAVRDQLDGYLAAGWRPRSPLYDCGLIVRRHNDPDIAHAMTLWWREIAANGCRDRVSFPYAMWKAGVAPMSLRPKGCSTRTIPELFRPADPSHGKITLGDVQEQIDRHRGA